jgi:plasmid stabilization system protein ParE
LKFKIYITNNAQKNLEEILNYIKLESKSRAQSLLIAIKEKILSLKSNPRRGRKVPEYNGEKEIREIIFWQLSDYL